MKKLGNILALVLAAGLLGGALFVLSAMKRPLGPVLALEAPAKIAAANAAQAAQPAAQQKMCGNTGKMSLVVIGQGLIENGNIYRTGALRLVVVNYDQPGVSVLSMPGELWVDARVLKDPSVANEKLDLIYHQTFVNAGNVPAEVAHVKGTQALAQAVVDNFGFTPDHYVTVLQESFVELVDTLGGIDVTLPEEVFPRVASWGVYPAGPQHLSGTRALNLTRTDLAGGQPNQVWGRFDRQNVVMQGLLGAILKPENWVKAPDLVKEARKAILTDLSVDQAMDLKCMVDEIGSQANLLEVDEEMVTVDGEGHWNPDFEAVKALIRGMVGE